MSAADWLSAIAALAAAGAGIGVAFATYALARSTNRLAELTAKTLGLAERQLGEAVRARADERAPRVVAIVAPPGWPPSASPRWVGAESATFDVGTEFVIPREDETRLMLRTHGLLQNEGSSSAVVQLNGPADFVEGVGSFRSIANCKIPTAMGGGRYALQPGQTALFRFEDGRPVKEWREAWKRRAEAPRESKLHLEIIVADQFDDGIVDNLFIEVQAYPVEPVGDDSGRWVVRPKVSIDGMTSAASTAYPVKRRYWRSKVANELA